MKLSKQEVIDKISSFSYKELSDWIKSRLHGEDNYFPANEGYETNPGKFISETVEPIKDATFMANYLEILIKLTDELSCYSKTQIEKETDYVYELLLLCRSINQFEIITALYEIADDRTLKGIPANNIDLHLVLLSTLASYQVCGDYEFWIDQMHEKSNKDYVGTAFYAILNRGYRLDIVFEPIGFFIDRFKGEQELVEGLLALVEKHGEEEIVGMFKEVEYRLSPELKKAVDKAFRELGLKSVYKLNKAGKNDPDYMAISSYLEKVSMAASEYGNITPLEKKTIEAFKLLGFDVEVRRSIMRNRCLPQNLQNLPNLKQKI